MTEYLNVGKIVNTQGLKGEVRILSQTDFPEERFAKGETLVLFMDEKKPGVELTVASHRVVKNFDVVSFVDHPSINDVEKFKGGLLKVDAEDLADLYDDEYYYHEIIGLTVIDEQGRNLGKVTDIMETGANDVWTIARPGKKDWLLPYVAHVVKKIDLEKGEVHIELMEGLIDED